MIVLCTGALAVVLRRIKGCIRLGELKPLRAPEVESGREKGVADGGCLPSSARSGAAGGGVPPQLVPFSLSSLPSPAWPALQRGLAAALASQTGAFRACAGRAAEAAEAAP